MKAKLKIGRAKMPARKTRSDKGKGKPIPSRIEGGPNVDRGLYDGVLANLTVRVDPR
jgi:hypothetical protein